MCSVFIIQGQFTVYNVLFAVCCFQSDVYSVQCAVCSVQISMNSFQCPGEESLPHHAEPGGAHQSTGGEDYLVETNSLLSTA